MRTKSIPLVSLLASLLAPAALQAQTPAPFAPVTPAAPVAAPVPAAPAAAPAAPAPVPVPVAAPVTSPVAGPAPVAAPVAAPSPVAAPVSTPVVSPTPAAPSTEPAAVIPDEGAKVYMPQLSLGGPMGLLRMSSTDIGPPLKLRVGLHGEYFSTSKFLVAEENGATGDKNKRLQGALTFSLTPTDFLEVFGAVMGSANRNTRQRCTVDSTSGQSNCADNDPEVIKSFGDLVLGAKLAMPIANGFSAGGEFGLKFLSSVNGISFSGESTSFWLNGIAGYDLRDQVPTVPLRFHANLGYFVDKSSKVQNYDALNASPFARYVSQFAYGISHSRLRLALGADVPLVEVTEGLSIRPLIEYHFEYLNGDKDQVIYDYERQSCGQPGKDSCKENKDQQWITLGIQGQVLGNLTLNMGLDVGVKSVGFAYGPPLAPWNFLFGASYALDLVPRVITKKVIVEKSVVAEKPAEGMVAGKIVGAAGVPVDGAVIGVVGKPHSRVVSDADGTFQTVLLPPGPVELLVVANGFETATVRTEIIAGQTANVALTLAVRPPAARATGTVSDESGKGIPANIKLAGPQIADGKSDEAGRFAIPVLPGRYTVRVDAEQYLSKELPMNVAEGRDNALSVTLRTRPAVAGATFQDGKIALRQQVTFKSVGKKPSAELTPGMPHLLDEIVDILVNNPAVRTLRVEAHWDGNMPAAKAQALTDEQAKAVVNYLIEQGVAAERLTAVGMAGKKPIAPNLGAGKLKNRRVEFVVGN